MPSETVALRYMTRFRCIAERCEDTCCAGLDVPVTDERLRILRELTAGTPTAEEVRRFVRPGEGGLSFLQRGAGGCCGFLDGEGLCSLQRRHGEAALADICVTFPRVRSRWGERREVAGTLACPEVARLCLLAEDAMERVPAPDMEVARPERVGRIPEEALGLAETLRDAAVRLLGRREFPLASRLVFLGRMAALVDSLLGEEEAVGEWGALAEALARFEAPEVLEGMHRDFAALRPSGAMAAGLFASVLRSRLGAAGARFGALMGGVFASYGAPVEGAFDAEAAWRTYAERRARLEALHGARVERYFHHACVNHWMRFPVTDAAALPGYVLLLTLRMAMLRFVLMGHPTVVALCEGRVPAPEAPEALDAAAVECFQLLARYVDAAPDFLTLTEGLTSAEPQVLLGRTLIFARFFEGLVS